MIEEKQKYTEEFIKEADEVDEYNLPDWWVSDNKSEEIKKSEENGINDENWKKWL